MRLPNCARVIESIVNLSIKALRRPRLRRASGLGLILALLMVPSAPLAKELTALASNAMNSTAGWFPAAPFAKFSERLWRAIWHPKQVPAPVSLADRASATTSLAASLRHDVIYQGQKAQLSALPANSSGVTMNGLRPHWSFASSSSPDPISIDEAGVVTGLQPGLAWVTCSVGSATTQIPILVRAGSRPNQTSAQWAAESKLSRRRRNH